MSRKRKSGGPAPKPEPRRYDVQLRPAAQRGLTKLPAGDYRRVDARLQALAEDPRPPGAIKLEGGDQYRIRVGDYRIIYEIDDDRSVVRVMNIGHRREVYRDF